MFKQIRESLITRLMLYFFIAVVFVVVIFGANIAFGLKVHFKSEILPNISQYISYVTADIGVPPNLNKAKKLSTELGLKIRISGKGIDWKSHKDWRYFNKLKFDVAPAPYEKFKIAHYRGQNYVQLEREGYRFNYALGVNTKNTRYQRSIILLVATVLFLFILFLVIRRSLRPIQTISTGVKKIANGDLNSTIEVKQSFEFEQLAMGVNSMSAKIKEMLESKQQLLLAISHELRSPLTRAKVNLALIPESKAQAALQYDLNEMELLIAQLLESERLNQQHSTLEKSSFALDDLVKQVINDYFKAVTVTLELSAIEVFADKKRIILLIKNLLNNAVKYSQQSSNPVAIRIAQNNGRTVIEVEDFGIGMDEKDVAKITQAFYRVDSARQRDTGGFGLGLYLCQLIVNAHQGELQFKSKLDKGTKVTVLLPL